jgi:ABC-type sugar transport system ATPase subunit
MDITDPTPASSVLEVVGLTVEFPGVRALDEVNLDIRAGEVHALVGENGAGKSTLLKVLGGVYAPTAGTILLRGDNYAPRRPADARVHGIAVIYQEFTLFGDLTVAENVYAGREPYRRLSRGLRYAEMRRGCRELFDLLGVHIDPDARVADLTVSEQQLVEIAKALGAEGQVIVMDEPTAALAHDEVERLLEVVRRLRDEGRSVIYVSHRLEEVFSVADRATVLRDGRLVRTLDIADTDEDEMVRLMVGRDLGAVFHRDAVTSGDVVLRLSGVSAGRQLRDVDLEVRAGEVVGIGGVAGAGQAELTQAVFGAVPLRAGTMQLDGRPYAPATPADALAAGVGFLHEDRKRAGILPDLSVLQNLTISVLDQLRRGFARLLSSAAEAKTYQEYASRLRVKASGPHQPVSQLSGGNQQKVLLARALVPGGRVLMLNEPTRGVDIGAKAEIHTLINELTRTGTAVIMVSSDLPELLGTSDRIVVLSRGRVVGVLTGTDRTEENVIACATTGRRIGVPA